MAKLLSTIINGFISSVNFISGLAGSGWRISMVNGKAKAEFDDLVIRNTMTVFELLISKVRAIRGAMGITQANGKIKSVREDETNFYITIEEEMSFVANDIVRCLEFNGSKRAYWVTVSAVNGNEITVAKAEFANMSTPAAGDELVQFGNTTDKRRQSAIYLHADENGEPAIDVMFGIDKKSFDGCVKVRLGGDLPGTGGLKGFYSENGMIKGVDVEGSTVYCLYPDGTAELGAGAALFKPDKSGHIADGAISWEWDSAKQKYVCTMGDVILQWDNLSAEAKENLKGDPGTPGKDANLLPWVEDWDSNKMQIGADYLVSPKIFAGVNAGTADNPALTGVALGRGVITVNENGVEKQKSGVFGLKGGKIVFSIDENGDAFLEGIVNANGGVFENVIINGSSRSPFVRETDSIDIVIGDSGQIVKSTHDNVVPIADGGGWITAGNLQWDVNQSGREMCLANYKWGSLITNGNITYSAPAGKYFYEDGLLKDSITLNRECVVLKGYGDDKEFYGWIVLNRIDLGTVNKYGSAGKVLATGIVTGTDTGATVKYKTFDGGSITVSRDGKGRYSVNIPWNTNKYTVFLTGIGACVDYPDNPIKATLRLTDTGSFSVWTSDDDSVNDGSFNFQVVSTADWPS